MLTLPAPNKISGALDFSGTLVDGDLLVWVAAAGKFEPLIKTTFVAAAGTVALTGNWNLGGTYKITGAPTPVSSTDLASKGYVDSVAAGLSPKASVNVATVVSGTMASSFAAGNVVDGQTLVTGWRIMIKDQGSVDNGLYTVNASGAPTRSSDMAAASHAAGAFCLVLAGTANAEKGFICTNASGSDVVGTNTLTFSQFSALASLSLEQLTDAAISSQAQGDILYWSGSAWVNLGHGTAGQVLQTNGAGANPSWATVGGGGSSPPFSDTSAIVENNADHTKLLKFSLSAIATATTRTITIPNQNVDLTPGNTFFPAIASPAQGDVVYYNGTAWTVLGPGTAKYVLQTLGAGANPAWASAILADGTIPLSTGWNVGGQTITGLVNPNNPSDACTKSYADTLAAGIQYKDAVKVATTGAGTLSSSFAAGQVVDGYTLVAADPILVKNQATPSENGIYLVNASGAPTRRSDLATGANAAGSLVFVDGGTANLDQAFVCTSAIGSDLVGTNSLTWTKYGAVSYTLENLSDVSISSPAQGSTIYFNGTNWVALGVGTPGQFLQTQGASANPQWAAPTFGSSLSDVSLTSAAQGDVYYNNGSKKAVNLAAGTNGQFLQTQGASANPQWAAPTFGSSLSDVSLTSAAQGDILYWSGSAWVNLGHGTAGQVLQTNGAGANPSWATVGGGGSSPPFSDTSAIVENNADHTKLLKFSLSAIATATTRTITIPNQNVDLTPGNTFFPAIASPAQGDVVYYNGTAWTVLGPGTAKYVLQTLGAGANPAWASAILADGTIPLSTGWNVGGQTITGLVNPNNPSDACTKSYADTLAAGIQYKDAVKVATTGAGTLSSSFAAGQVVDGYTLVAADPILVKNQATPSENGIYLVNASGAPTRRSDLATGANAAGSLVFVDGGTANLDQAFVCTSAIGSDLVGTNSLTWTKYGAVSYTLENLSDVSISSPAQGSTIYFNGTNWVALGVGTPGQFLQTQGASANPQWAAPTFGSSLSDVSLTSAAQGDVYYNNGSKKAVNLAAGTNGQFLQTQGASANPQWAAPTFGSSLSDVSLTSAAQGDVYYNDGTHKAKNLGPGTAGQFLMTGGASANPSWSSSGTLPGSAAQGDILYEGASSAAWLAPGTAGQVLMTNGSSANPQWIGPFVCGPVRAVATTSGALSTAYANGQVVNGYTLVMNDRILLTAQSTPSENGIYVVTGGTPTRAADMPTGMSASGVIVPVLPSTTVSAPAYMCASASGSDLVGTNSLTFNIFGAQYGAATTSAIMNVVGFNGAGFTGFTLNSGLIQIDTTNNSRLLFTSAAGTVFALTDGSTITIDFTKGNIYSVTLGGNRTIAFSNAVAGQSIRLYVTQDATGSRTLTWPTIKAPAATAPALSTGANKIDCIVIEYDGTNYYVTLVGNNYS